MWEIHPEGEASKKAPEYHDLPPRYNLCQLNRDRLSYVIENEYEARKLGKSLLSHQAELKSLTKIADSTEHDISKLAILFQTGTRVLADGSSIFA